MGRGKKMGGGMEEKGKEGGRLHHGFRGMDAHV